MRPDGWFRHSPPQLFVAWLHDISFQERSLPSARLQCQYTMLKNIILVFLYTSHGLDALTIFGYYELQATGRSSAWLERLVRDQEVAGSNPVAPSAKIAGF